MLRAAVQSAGQPCPEVILVNFQTGEEVALSSIVGNGKPTVLDYCASRFPASLFLSVSRRVSFSSRVCNLRECPSRHVLVRRVQRRRRQDAGEIPGGWRRCQRPSRAHPPCLLASPLVLARRRRWQFSCPTAASHSPSALSQINIEGGTAACSGFNDKHSLTLPHFGLKDKAEIEPFGVKYIPHHVAIAADGSIQESPSDSTCTHPQRDLPGFLGLLARPRCVRWPAGALRRSRDRD